MIFFLILFTFLISFSLGLIINKLGPEPDIWMFNPLFLSSLYNLLNSLFTVSSNYRDLSENTKDYSTTKANLEQLKRANIELDYKLKNIKIISQQKHETQPTVVSSNCNNRKIMTRRHTIHAISDPNY